MKTITVEKSLLQEKLTSNRAAHQEAYNKALAGWMEEVYAALAQAGRKFAETKKLDEMNFHYEYPKPVSYTDEYDRALEMLEWEVEDRVELEEDEFRRLVQDEWNWTRTFVGMSSRYTVTD